MSGEMAPLPGSSATAERFAEAKSKFQSGDLEGALELFTAIANDDAWFSRAYEFLRQIHERLKERSPPNSPSWKRIVELEARLEQTRRRLEDKASGNIWPRLDYGRDDDLDHAIIRNRLENLTDDLSTGGRRKRGISVDPSQRPGGSTNRRGQTVEVDVADDLSPDAVVAPKAEIIERTPHIDVLHDGPVRPNDIFGLDVYLDTLAARPGETSVKVVAATGSEVEVNIVTSEHFRVLGEPSATFVISKDDLRTDIPQFRLECVSQSQWGDGAPVIIAMFFVDGRPCGKVSRTVNVAGLAVDEAPAAGAVQIGPNGGPPADLTVTIVADEATNDGRRFWCSVTTPHLPQYAKRTMTPWILRDVAQKLVAGYMEGFTTADKEMLVASLSGAGKQLFEASPKLFQEVFWQLVDQGVDLRTIAIVSAEPFIPWELMIPNRWVDTRYEEHDRPLGVRYGVGRWTDERVIAPPRAIALSDAYVIAPAYQGNKVLKYSASEAKMVLDQYPGQLVEPAKFAQLQTALGGLGRSLVHFVCHGTDGDSGIQSIHLEGDDVLTATSVLGLTNIAKIFAAKRPVVFLNACEVGRGAPALVGLGGFAASFIRLGASAVIAPLWSVDDEIAHTIATDFYSALKEKPGMPFSRIFAEIRAKAYDQSTGKDTYAAYCFYGDPFAAA